MGRIRRIAIVDDDAGVRDSIAQLIKGRTKLRLVTECARAKDALTRLPDSNVNLVLLDIRMPGMDGIECCYELRKTLPNTAIAIFSGRRLPCYVNAARVAGADAYYCKGMEPRALLEELNELGRSKCLRLGPEVLLGGVTGKLKFTRGPNLNSKMERVLELEAKGLCVGEIADFLGLHEQTIYRLQRAAMERISASACLRNLENHFPKSV